MDRLCEIRGVYKIFSGNTIIDGLDLDVYKGEILGILGPNGSGKTTLLKMMTDFLNIDRGSILIDGRRPGVYTKSIVAYMPDESFIPKTMTGEKIRDFFIDFFPDFNQERFKDLVAYMDLDLTKKLSSLSKGMEERLNLSLTLSRDARLYILDEPLGGIDLISRDKILNTIIDSFNRESSMIITTHLLGDMEYIFDRLVFMDQGKIILEGGSEALRREYGKSPEEIYREIYGEDRDASLSKE